MKNNKRSFALFLPLLLCALIILSITSKSLAQSSDLVLDSIHIAMRNLQTPEENLPPSVYDTAYASQKIELNLSIYISDPKNIKSLQFAYGTTSGASDLINVPLTYLLENGKDYLVYQNNKFPIINKRVTISRLVPRVWLKKVAYISLRAKDNSNLLTSIKTKRYN